jgi:hypothetical protein
MILLQSTMLNTLNPNPLSMLKLVLVSFLVFIKTMEVMNDFLTTTYW